MESTLAIIKPNAIQLRVVGKIIQKIEDSDLSIAEMKMVRLTQDQAEGFYKEHRGKPFFQSLVSFMTSGPVILMVLKGEGAVEKWRRLMGATDPSKAAPGTIRQLYGESIEKNCVHGSDSLASAQREVAYFFG